MTFLLILATSASFKSFWNLINVVQVLAYMRFYARLPAFMHELLVNLESSVTLKPITDKIFDFGKTRSELVNQTLSDENLKELGITDSNMLKGLGVFSILPLIYNICVGIYFLLSIIKVRDSVKVKSTKKWLKHKLFFNSAISYLLVGNLKWTIYAMGFSLYQNNKGFVDLFKATTYHLLISFIALYPLLFMYFLFKYQDKLDIARIKAKYNSAYDGIYTESKYALLYSTMFCLRRFYLVLINVTFNASCPWTHFAQNQYLLKIFSFLTLQTAYLAYIYMTRPHIISLYNWLELSNELALVLLAYIIIAYSDIFGQTTCNLLAEVIAFLILVINFGFLIV